MALSSSIFKVQVNIANIDQNVYEDASLTLALHPSETEERMMMRLVAFIVSFEENLEFSDGLSNPDQPDIWKKNLMGDVEHWIEIGQPEEKKIKKAFGLSSKVSVFNYNEYKSSTWLEKIKGKLKKNKEIKVYQIEVGDKDSLNQMVKRTMLFNAMIEDGALFLSDEEHRVEIAIKEQGI